MVCTVAGYWIKTAADLCMYNRELQLQAELIKECTPLVYILCTPNCVANQ